MRAYSISRSTAQWAAILHALEGFPMRHVDSLVTDLKQMLAFDDKHVTGVAVDLPDGVENSSDPEWAKLLHVEWDPLEDELVVRCLQCGAELNERGPNPIRVRYTLPKMKEHTCS